MIPSPHLRSTYLHVAFGAAPALALAMLAAGHLPGDPLQGRPLEGALEAAGCGPWPLDDEASFLQVSPPLVVRPSHAEAAPPMGPMLAWLQEQRTRLLLRSFLAATTQFSPLGIAFIAIVALCFGLVVMWFLYVFLTAPVDLKAAGGLQTPPRSLSRINSRDSAASKQAYSEATTTPHLAREVTQSTARDDPIHIFAIPGLKDSPLEQYKQTKYAVRDAEGQKILHVDVMRPPKDEAATGWQAEEYVALWSGDGSEELAMCALGSDPEDSTGYSWACHVYQGGTQIFGYLQKDADEAPRGRGGPEVHQYSLLTQMDGQEGQCILTLIGDLISRQMEVRSGDRIVARVTPGGFNFGAPGEYYRASCTQEADVGMVVLALLGAERSYVHTAKRKRGPSR